MNPEQLLNILACLAVLAFGLYAAVQPRASAKLAGMPIDGAKGIAEIRIAFGAFSIALGAASLILNQQVAYQTSGIVFLAALAMRLLVCSSTIHPWIAVLSSAVYLNWLQA
jgi:hypothetical protein